MRSYAEGYGLFPEKALTLRRNNKKKFIPYEKLNKKERRRIDSEKRRDWAGINPVTRIADTDLKKYRRKPKYPDRF